MSLLLPENLSEPEKTELPSADVIRRAGEATNREVNHITNVPDQVRFQAEEIKQVFAESLESLKAEGWEAVIDTSSKTRISVDQEEKKVKIPSERKLGRDKLRALIAHELGTHVTRRVNGERSRLMILGLGLDRYERGEEGIATMREQAIAGKVEEFAGLEPHFAIGLAVGLDGNPRNFRTVYSVLEKYFQLKGLLGGKEQGAALLSAKTNAWNMAVRTFRGTDCKTTGVCFTKDIVYREGNMVVWDVIRDRPEEMMRFSVGKYDPANERHIWILNTLGISDEDLTEEQNKEKALDEAIDDLNI